MKLCNGKYEFYTDEIGVLHCKRNGEEWPSQDENLLGNKAIHALYNHAKELEKKQTELEADYKEIHYLNVKLGRMGIEQGKGVELGEYITELQGGPKAKTEYEKVSEERDELKEQNARLKNELDVVQGELDRLRAEGWTCDR